jgi:hypothetical protein
VFSLDILSHRMSVMANNANHQEHPANQHQSTVDYAQG